MKTPALIKHLVSESAIIQARRLKKANKAQRHWIEQAIILKANKLIHLSCVIGG